MEDGSIGRSSLLHCFQDRAEYRYRNPTPHSSSLWQCVPSTCLSRFGLFGWLGALALFYRGKEKDRSKDLILLAKGIIVDSTPSDKSNSLVAREPKPRLSGWSAASSPASKRALRVVWCGFCSVVWNEQIPAHLVFVWNWWKRYELQRSNF